jgi:hypothetical protein
MDDTAQKQNQVSDNAQAQVQPQVPAQPQPVGPSPLGGTPQPQVTPVGTANKEVEAAPVGDFIKPSETAAIKDREVAEAGIVEAEREIKIEEEHEKLGIRPEPAPVITEPTKIDVQSLMTPAEVKADLKKGPGTFNISGHYLGIYFTNSKDFLVALLNKILRKQASQPA